MHGRPVYCYINSTSINQLLVVIHIDGLAQHCSISIANALEILQSCTKPSIWWTIFMVISPQGTYNRWHKYHSRGWDMDRQLSFQSLTHDDVIKWKHFARYWPFVGGIHRSSVNSPHKGQWRGALMLSLICVRINGWVNNLEAGDLRRYRPHCDVIVMSSLPLICLCIHGLVCISAIYWVVLFQECIILLCFAYHSPIVPNCIISAGAKSIRFLSQHGHNHYLHSSHISFNI